MQRATKHSGVTKRSRNAPADTTHASRSAAEVERAVSAMEGEIWDLLNMANLVVSQFEQTFGHDDREITGKADTYYLPRKAASMHVFAVYHLEQMVKTMSENYFAALGMGRQD